MTNRETLRDVINDIQSEGGIPQEQLNSILLSSIANSLAIIADALPDRKDNSNGVESMLKAYYEARLKANKIAMLEELKLEFEQYEPKWAENEDQLIASNRTWDDFDDIIQQKINKLKEDKDETHD